MKDVWQWITLLSSMLTAVATVAMVVTFGRERRVGSASRLLSIAISVIAVLVYVLISGARTSWLAALAALGIGLAIGSVRGLLVQLSWRDGRVVGRNSWLLLLVWGMSYAAANLFNLSRSPLLSSSGLILLCLSTGTQVGDGAALIIRSLSRSRAAAPPAYRWSGVLPEHAPSRSASAAPATLPERG